MPALYYMSDQPTNCPICGARTDIISDLLHTNLKMLVNECLDIHCKHVFLETEPETENEGRPNSLD
jgi:hypothetical protein